MQLVIVDTAQIQPYIFGSNRLRENLGASWLVAQATQDWAWKHLPEPNNRGPKNNFTDAQIDAPNSALAAEAIYAGGGNFVALIREKDAAENFVRGLSRQVLTDAPGLHLLIDSHPFEWNDSLVLAVRDAFTRLAEQKRMRAQTAPLLGLGITASCQGTGLPAVEWVTPVDTDTGYPASAEICAKLRAVDKANEELENRFATLLKSKFEFPYDLDHLGRSEGEFSHIAIVHADGDSMSERFQACGNSHLKPEDNRKYIDAVRQLSEQVKTNSHSALYNLVDKLIQRIDANQTSITHNPDGHLVAKIEMRENDKSKRRWLPFRPIVFGGDDVTFVCDGRLGLALAAEYLEDFNAANQNLGATACAGVTITKTHYPFARGYALAEDLCQSAKTHRAALADKSACMDWHFALSGLAGDIGEIRRREYRTRAGWLHLRPVNLPEVAENELPPLQSWQATEKFARVFQSKDWMTRRNKAKALRDALRQGETSVKRFRTLYLCKDDQVELLPDGFAAHSQKTEIRKTGWVKLSNDDAHAVYFDALELADWYVPLEK
ncbi:MAG: hypothetical protein B6D41_00580 [Chloroflexi bacterium UTCFX4]|jgi:hypothetical protein|nr:MAG: hypothetical protein B6D41_00580 [Chloroflexi bacterium UTCFX4]